MKKDVTAIAKPEFSLIDENMLKSRIYTIRGSRSYSMPTWQRFMGIAPKFLISRLKTTSKNSMKIFAFS